MSRSLILLDVDGVLNPWNKQGPHWQTHQATAHDMSYRVVLNPGHGPMLLQLAHETGAELVWATTWEHHANRAIAPLIGLPELPVIEVGRPRHLHDSGALFKTPAVADYVTGRPFVWLDDDLTQADRAYLASHDSVGEFLLIHVDDHTGVTKRHLERAASWLADHREVSSS